MKMSLTEVTITYPHPDDPSITVVCDGVTKKWYRNNVLHRTDGPAIELLPGMLGNFAEKWYVNGKLHRTNGPAVVWYNGAHSWYIDGVQTAPRTQQ